jgi:TatA/E family protein of Tat protein translocase
MSYFPSVAFLTGSVGAGEWVVLFVVVLIVVGPKRLPEVARKLGRTMEMFRRAADEFKDQLMTMDQEQTSSSSPTSSSATPSTDADGVPSDPYENHYPDASGYPGNEDHVENWSSDSAGQAGDGAAEPQPAESAEPTPVPPNTDAPVPEKPAEGGQ